MSDKTKHYVNGAAFLAVTLATAPIVLAFMVTGCVLMVLGEIGEAIVEAMQDVCDRMIALGEKLEA